MFARSAAPDTLQGKAICHVNSQWGEDSLKRSGRESLAAPVCKKKYTPFVFPIVKRCSDADGRISYEVQVERMYACKCHHQQRKKMIEKYGERQGWEPFGQWSLKKALELARRETQRLNSLESKSTSRSSTPPVALTPSLSSIASSSSSDSGYDDDEESEAEISVEGAGVARNMCLSGKCLWKVRTAYDNVFKELTGFTESEAEDNDS